MDSLEQDHPTKTAIFSALLECAGQIGSLGQAEAALQELVSLEDVESVTLDSVDLSTGSIRCVITLHPQLFYQILSQRSGINIRNDGDLVQLLTELSAIRREYDKVSGALSAVRATGYGVVMPTAEEMALQPPEIVKKGGSYGLKLKAESSSIHMIRVDVDTEISPIVGDEQQSKDLVAFLSAESPEKLWQSNIFGKSVYELIQDGLTAKLIRLPEDVRAKFRGTMQRIINEGAQGLICLIL
jgi:stage IV sporulation protein A